MGRGYNEQTTAAGSILVYEWKPKRSIAWVVSVENLESMRVSGRGHHGEIAIIIEEQTETCLSARQLRQPFS